MAVLLRQVIGLLILTIFGLVQSRISVGGVPSFGDIAISEKAIERSILRRQSTSDCAALLSDPDAPLCEAICAPSSSSCSSRSIEKRELTVGGSIDGFINGSRLGSPHNDHYLARRLARRAFTAITQGQIPTYLPDQFSKNVDPAFGSPQDLVETVPNAVTGRDDETDNTVVRQLTFGAQPFAVGARAIHGCTMITVVSSQAVYMGHFWEDPSFTGRSNNKDWRERVINFFKGGTTFGIGPRLDVALFPPGDTNTRVFIMTPRRTPDSAPTLERYPGKLPALIQAIKDGLGYQDVPIAVFKYKRLDYDIEEDLVLADTSQRGVALFQYDPTGRGPSQHGWRLFCEHNQFSDSDPPPNSPNGVPDV